MNFPFIRKRGAVAPVETSPFTSLQREIDRVLSDFSRGWPDLPAGWGARMEMPRMDIVEKDGMIVMTAELPGLEAKDVEISVADNVLTLHGERKSEREEKDENRYLSERTYGAFSRSIELPEEVNADDVKAEMANGVLRITLPKPAQPMKTETRRIDVTAAP